VKGRKLSFEYVQVASRCSLDEHHAISNSQRQIAINIFRSFSVIGLDLGERSWWGAMGTRMPAMSASLKILVLQGQ
jgi:hypothetical protein